MAGMDLVPLFIVCCLSNIKLFIHYSIARVLVCEVVLLFTLTAGRRLAELELVLFLVQVCVPMSIAVHICM